MLHTKAFYGCTNRSCVLKRIKSWTLISGIYRNAPLGDRLHVFIRQKTAPWDVFFNESFHSGNLLDYGCGHGLLLALFRQMQPGLRLYGIDHDERKKRVVHQCLPEVKIIEPETLTRLYPERFDYVVICDMLYFNHERQREKIIADISRCLKPGGRLIMKETVSTPRVKYYLVLLHELIVTRLLKLTKAEQLAVPPPDDYVHLLTKCGFKVIENKPVHGGYLHPHHLLIGIK